MLYYRLYFLHRFTGHIVRFSEFEASDDAAALALAAEHEGDQPLELWCRHRKVGRFERVGDQPDRPEREAQPGPPKAFLLGRY